MSRPSSRACHRQRHALKRAAGAGKRLVQQAKVDPLSSWRPTPPQLQFLQATEDRVLLRGPNQPGKTTATAVDVIWRMLGIHPYVKTHEPPIECWVVCTSWKQSKVIQAKVYALIPKAQLAPGTRYTRRNGFPGASFQTANGSLCVFLTANQDTAELASATVHHIAVDEPPPEHIWPELVSRVRQARGSIKVTMTPINRPVQWMREMVERGQLRDIHFALTVDNCWPIGAARPFQTQAQIDRYIDELPSFQRAQRAYGEWEGTTTGRWIDHFDEEKHTGIFAVPVGAKLGIGIDYGLQPGKMCAVLVAVVDGHTSSPRVWWVDEACAPEDVAWGTLDLVDAIRKMLERNRLTVADVDTWVGDRSAQSGTGKLENSKTRAVLAERTGQAAPYIDIPKKGPDSVMFGCALLSDLFRRDHARVHPRCRRFIAFLNHFAGDKRDKTKDAGDAGRYPVERMCPMRGTHIGRMLMA